MKTVKAEGENPLCGDTVSITIGLEHDIIVQAEWQGYGCSLCEGAAEYLVGNVIGMTAEEVTHISLEELTGTVSDVPVGRTRRKCVLLPLEALQKAVLNS